MIDTIIVNNKEEFKKYCKLDKHMVYLGQEPIEYRTLDRYFGAETESEADCWK